MQESSDFQFFPLVPFYKTYFKAIGMVRPAAAGRIFPKFGSVKVVLGLFGFTWFGMLNASARNCMDCFSRIRNTRVRPMSILMLPGPRIFREPMVPYVPSAGCTNAAGLSQD